MSEIKGQLLGMVLVLSIFALVAGVLCGTFKRTAEKIDETVSSQVNHEYAYVL